MRKLWFSTVLFVVLFLGSSGVAYYFYQQYLTVKADPQRVAQDEVAALVARVGRLIVLPEGEMPTVATVNDPEKLKDQPFFANAKAGFKVLIYTNAKKAILYDPVGDKIVEVAPVNIGASTGASSAEDTSASSPSPSP